MKFPRTSQQYWNLAQWLRVIALGIAGAVLLLLSMTCEAYVDMVSPDMALHNAIEAIHEAEEHEREVRDGPFYDPDHPETDKGTA